MGKARNVMEDYARDDAITDRNPHQLGRFAAVHNAVVCLLNELISLAQLAREYRNRHWATRTKLEERGVAIEEPEGVAHNPVSQSWETAKAEQMFRVDAALRQSLHRLRKAWLDARKNVGRHEVKLLRASRPPVPFRFLDARSDSAHVAVLEGFERAWGQLLQRNLPGTRVTPLSLRHDERSHWAAVRAHPNYSNLWKWLSDEFLKKVDDQDWRQIESALRVEIERLRIDPRGVDAASRVTWDNEGAQLIVCQGTFRASIPTPTLRRLFQSVAQQSPRSVSYISILKAWAAEDRRPKVSTDTLRRAGSRLRSKLGPLGFLWEQDGEGAAWNASAGWAES